jgi:hypothetical protein
VTKILLPVPQSVQITLASAQSQEKPVSLAKPLSEDDPEFAEKGSYDSG